MNNQGETVTVTRSVYTLTTETFEDGQSGGMTDLGDVDTATLSTELNAAADHAVEAQLAALFAASDAESSLVITTASEEERSGEYRLLTPEEMEASVDRVTRSLRITRLRADAENSRVVLRFDYRLVGDADSQGFFYRTVAIDTGLAAELRVNVTPVSVVVPKGGTGEVTLVVSNLKLGEDPADFITFKLDNADLSIVLGDADLDPISRRLVQTLHVSVDEDADRSSYEVNVIVRLRGEVLRTKFTVDVNDPPRYEGRSASDGL